MLDVTFLGHQGWLLRGARASVLLDPLLGDRFCAEQGRFAYAVHPARVSGGWPAIDAVILSHEHEDHLDLPSLATIARTVPIYLSERSSKPARGALRALGFDVRPLSVSSPLVFDDGDLVVHPLVPNHAALDTKDELDVLPLLVHGRETRDAFFTAIDVPDDEHLLAQAAARAPRPVVVTHTFNAPDLSAQFAWLEPNVGAERRYASAILETARRYARTWAEARCGLLVGNGYRFPPALERLNRRAFPVDNQRVANALALLGPTNRFFAPLPGTTLEIRDGEVSEIRTSPFVTVDPSTTCDRALSGERGVIEDFPPLTRATFDDAALGSLRANLQDFATYLFGGRLQRSLASLVPAALGGTKPTFVLSLLTDEDRSGYLFAYDAADGAFVPVDVDDAARTYVAGMELFAADLDAIFEGEARAASVLYGHCVAWNHAPSHFTFDLDYALRMFTHPLHRPRAAERLFASIAKSLTPSEPAIVLRR